MLKRKIDDYLLQWYDNPARMPLIVKGGRQVGKTTSILTFAKQHYKHVININFAIETNYKLIFDDGYGVDSVIRNISLFNSSFVFEEGQTLIFFDEMQACPSCATCLKAFKLDGRFDVICSGSLTGIHYHEIESNSVGYKEDYTMYSLDFEEFLWANGYDGQVIQRLLNQMRKIEPLSSVEMDVMMSLFRTYMIIGGMPAVVNQYVKNKNFSGALKLQRQLLLDYEEDITKYAEGLDKGRIENVFNHIPVFLARENKKFQITKVAHHARNREYIGVVDWLDDAGIVNVCYCLDQVALPLKGNYNPSHFKLYFKDTGLLVAALDDEAQEDLRVNRNFNTYKGAIYENIIAETLVKQGYNLFFFRNEKSTVEMDFFVRDKTSLIPVEVKANDSSTPSLNKLLSDNDKYPDIKYGIKFCNRNIGFNGKFYTFPYCLAFLIRRFLNDK